MGVGVGAGVAVGATEPLGLGVGVGAGVAVGATEPLGPWVGVGAGVGLAVGAGVGVGVRVPVGAGVGVVKIVIGVTVALLQAAAMKTRAIAEASREEARRRRDFTGNPR